MQDATAIERHAAGVITALWCGALGLGCSGFRAEDEATGTTLPPSSLSSSSLSSSIEDASGSHGDASTSTDTPSRPVPPPFELPPGCGDGVVVPGQYDCFVPAPIHWPGLMAPRVLGEGHDIDGDGHQEIAYASPSKPQLLSYGDRGFALGPGAATTIGGYNEEFSWRWDWDGDGKQDLTSFPIASDGEVAVNASLGKDIPGTWLVVHEWNERLPSSGRAVPIDVDGDGQLEVVVSHRLMPQWENSPTEITVRRRVGDSWQPNGPTFPFGGCGVLSLFAFGDVDGDGDDDLALADDTFSCDPHPSQYDPGWHVVGVFLVDVALGELQLAGWFPTGYVSNATWFELADADGDGVLDVVMNFEGEGVTAGYMHGRGDGTFDQGVRVTLDVDAPPHVFLETRADLDGDGDREWLASGLGAGNRMQLHVLENPLSSGVVKPFATIEDPLAGYSHTAESRHACDFNGDGVGDLFVRTNDGTPYSSLDYVMLSAP